MVHEGWEGILTILPSFRKDLVRDGILSKYWTGWDTILSLLLREGGDIAKEGGGGSVVLLAGFECS